jgi:hypothetical protein
MAARLTRALVKLHGAGRADAYRAALLDVAQDHLLAMLADEGFFNDERLIFKGGTSLRKCRLGNSGRFSTDLDFCAPDENVVLDVVPLSMERCFPGSSSAWSRRAATVGIGRCASGTTSWGLPISEPPSSSRGDR